MLLRRLVQPSMKKRIRKKVSANNVNVIYYDILVILLGSFRFKSCGELRVKLCYVNVLSRLLLLILKPSRSKIRDTLFLIL